MARSRRLFISGKVYHLTQEGNNRVPVFHTDQDRDIYLEYLAHAAKLESVSIHGWCLLENQIDLLVSADSTTAISRMMSRVQGRYARAFNRIWHRSGSLWRKRFIHREVRKDSHLPSCFRHLDHLPVIRKLAGKPEDWAWSSHNSLAHGRNAAFLKPHSHYMALGRTRGERQRGYRSWMNTLAPSWTRDT